MKNIKFLVAVLTLAAFAKVQAQADSNTALHTLGITIPAVAIVDIEPSVNAIALVYQIPVEAGEAITAPGVNSTLWMNYSFIPTVAGKTANVSAKISAIVAGLDINVQAGNAVAGGGGTKGAPAGMVTLDVANKIVVDAIGASYTGSPASFGHNLTYSADAVGGTSDYASLFATTPILTVTYTIAEN